MLNHFSLMRHTAHLMLGSNAEHIAKSIKQYVAKYGNEEANDYFKAILYSEDSDKQASFKTATLIQADESVFTSGIDEMYVVEFGMEYAVPDDHRVEYFRGFFRELYNNSVTINHPGDCLALNLCIYLPLYKKEFWVLANEILDAVESIPQQFNVDFFLLPYDLSFLFDKDAATLPERIAEYAGCTTKILNTILEEKKNYPSLSKLVMIQNCNADGVSLGLNVDSFVRIIGEYAVLSISNYPEMFPAAAQDPSRPIHALGLSVLSFDKFYFVQYLLHKAYAFILDRENVSQSEVEVNKVSQIVQSLLSNNILFFSKFYDDEIAPKLNDKMEQAEIISVIEPKLRIEIERLKGEFQSYIDKPDLSLPEKKATLAQLLGEDDDLLIGYMFNKKQLILDDCSREVLDFFVLLNNSLCTMTPEVGNVQDEKIIDSIKEYASLSKEGEPIKMASELLDELKETKVTMRESTNYIRQKTIELEGLDIQRKEHRESHKRLTKDGFVFEGNTYRLQSEIEERDLDESYRPIPFVPHGSIDLRSTFTPVKDQGNMGACSAFATVGIFESILKKNCQPDIDLSEQFVYYNARKTESGTRDDAGCSLYAAISTMSTEGVCLEHFFPYNPGNITFEPPKEAYDDAANRKVVKAQSVAKDVDAIRSAIYEGYPVAISLRIFDSFNPRRGFISTPSEEEIGSAEFGNHAMIVCGFNDEARFFVVRNSWGQKFGIKGYCYIPYSYLGDPKLLNGACIITDISDTKLTVKGSDQKAVVSFDLADSNIKSEILKNLIREEKIKLDRLTNKLTERSKNFNTLFQQLGNNTNREAICDGTKERLDYECNRLRIKENELQIERSRELDIFDSESKTIRWYFWGAITAIIIIFITIWAVNKSIDTLISKPAIITYIVIAIAGVFFWLVMRHRKRLRKDLDMDYKNQLSHIALKISSRVREKEITHLKSHLAGMIIDSFYKLNRNLHTKYNGMRSYVGNLKTWRDQEAESLQMSPLVREPFLTLVSNETLDAYFEIQKEAITEGVALSKMFRDRYKVEESEIVKFKNNLKKTLVNMLFSVVKDFSIFKYVTRAKEYPYVDRNYNDIDALLKKMDNKSNPFVRFKPTVTELDDLNTYCKIMFLHTDENEDRRRWEDACNRDFSNRPVLHKTDTPYRVTMLQLKGISPDDISILG